MTCFKQLDKEIIEDARRSNIKDCQYGGTTALVALRFGQVCVPSLHSRSPQLLVCALQLVFSAVGIVQVPSE